jgi:hypothetical protein
MALTAAQIVDCRRFMGYSVSGDDVSNPYRELVYSNVSYFGLSIDYRLQHLSPEEETVVSNKFLVNLNLREDEIQGAAANLDTDQAAVWYHNKQEVSDRTGLFNELRYDLCTFLGFRPGPNLATTNRLVRA